MNRIRNILDRLGEKLFPEVEDRKRRRLTIQILAGLILVLFSIAGTAAYKHWEAGQMRKFQNILKMNKVINQLPESYAEKASQEKERTKEEDEMSETEEKEETVIAAYNWDSLLKINGDIKGWLYIPDTTIDFPVAGAADDDYYLSHNFYKEKSSLGCPFMDKDTQEWDFNKVIYAHNMGKTSTAMFSPLLDYKEEDYFMEHRTVYYTEVFGSTTAYQVMAVVRYDVKDTGEWDFRTRNHEDMESYNIWMEELQGRALYYAEPDHAPVSILTLSTCDRSEVGKDGRLLIVAGKIV